MTKLHELAELGQAVWLDYIRRSFITSGGLQQVIDQGVRGVTSNPSIFDKAITGSTDYDEDLRTLVRAGKTVDEIYEALVIDDIRAAADLLRPLYDRSGGGDGYVSLEVNPDLAHNTERTVAEARRLFAAVDRPNIMIKIPATAAGFPAIAAVLGHGINVNVTLIFSLAQYERVVEAFLSGLEKLAAAGGEVGKMASVASFFVSRVDTAVDAALEKAGRTDRLGRAAVSNAVLAYARFRELFRGERWEKLAGAGARRQRPLWASTGTKNPRYSDTLYVDSLIGPHTVNTLPPATLQAFLDHGRTELTLESGVEEARAFLSQLGVDLNAITRKLLEDGVAAFAESFHSLMAGIAEKREKILTSRSPS